MESRDLNLVQVCFDAPSQEENSSRLLPLRTAFYSIKLYTGFVLNRKHFQNLFTDVQ